MKTIKCIILFVFSFLLLSLAACGNIGPDREGITVRMTITAGDTIILNDVEIRVKAYQPTVIGAVQEAIDEDDGFPKVRFDDAERPMTVLDIGPFLDTPDKYWEFRVNDKSFSQMSGKAGDYSLNDGDRVYYEYGAAFAEKNG